MSYMVDLDSADIAWLRLTEDDRKHFTTPLSSLSEGDKANFHLYVLRIMRDPAYFQWTVKVLLGVDLLPVQTVILRELWKRPFPMYIASRGFGKSFFIGSILPIKMHAYSRN